MHVLGVHHVALLVRDVEEARSFYVGVLGLDELERPDFGFPGAWLQAGDQQIHLQQVGEVPHAGLQHYALEVSDLDNIVVDLRDHGVAVDPLPHTPGAGRQAFLHDPSGNLIELNQPDPHPVL